MALGPAQPGHPRRNAHDGDADRYHPVGGAARRSVRVRRFAGRFELPRLHRRTPCYPSASVDAEPHGSGCPNGRAHDAPDIATQSGRFTDSRTGGHAGTHGVRPALTLAGTVGQPEPDAGGKSVALTFGGAVAERDCRAHPLTNACTQPIPDGEAAANAATVIGAVPDARGVAIAVAAGRAVRVLPFRLSGRHQRKE